MKLKADGVYFESTGIMCYVRNGNVFAADDQNTQPYGRATKTNVETAIRDCKRLVKDWEREQYCGD